MSDHPPVPEAVEASPITHTLRALEAAEANLAKAERVWARMRAQIPSGNHVGDLAPYENLRRAFESIVHSLPAIDGWKFENHTLSENELTRILVDDAILGDPELSLSSNELIYAPETDLAEYRFRFERMRRALTRPAILGLVQEIDRLLVDVDLEAISQEDPRTLAPESLITQLRSKAAQIGTLVGTGALQLARWSDLRRHLSFGQLADLVDIVRFDWPAVKPDLTAALYAEDEPIPVPVNDLALLSPAAITEAVPTRLAWGRLSAEDFERLIFALFANEPGYANAQWLTQTNAPDKGRDISVERTTSDALIGQRTERVIVQCKHRLSKPIGVAEIATLKEQMRLWQPPRVDVLIIATTGRFSIDAVQLIEQHRASDSALRIEPWPESHLEMLLARRPALIAELGLR